MFGRGQSLLEYRHDLAEVTADHGGRVEPEQPQAVPPQRTVGPLQDQVGASRAVLIYEAKGTAGGLLLAKSGTVERLDTPARDIFDRLVRILGADRSFAILAERAVWWR